MAAISVKETRVYKLAFELAMEIYMKFQKIFPKRKPILSLIKFADHRGVSAFAYWKLIAKNNILHILYQRFQTVIWKIQKLPAGLIFLWPVNTLMIQSIKN